MNASLDSRLNNFSDKVYNKRCSVCKKWRDCKECLECIDNAVDFCDNCNNAKMSGYCSKCE